MNKERVPLKDRLKEALELREKKPSDLVRDLKIPKSAVSQYLSGRSQKMDSERMYIVCKYLGVSEPWMMGYDVPMEAEAKKNSGTKSGTAETLTESQKILIDFAKSVPQEKADLILRVMKSILEDGK